MGFDFNSNKSVEEDLETLPEKVSEQLVKWRTASLDREKCEALLYARFHGEDPSRTATAIKSLINSNEERYQIVLKEIQEEAHYNFLYEKLMSAKKIASLRTAF